MKRALAISVMLICCFAGYAVAAGSEENAEDVLQLHMIEANWHTAQTNKDLNLMLSLFANGPTLSRADALLAHDGLAPDNKPGRVASAEGAPR